MVSADALEARSRPGEGSFVGDPVARERNPIRAVRERQVGGIGCKHDHDVVARIEERAERPVEERRAIDRFDDLRAAKASGGATSEKDPRGPAHARMVGSSTRRV